MLKEWVTLLFLAIYIRLRRFMEYLYCVLVYYWNPEFRRADIALQRRYFFVNPYTVARQFALFNGEVNLHTYGETPLPTLAKIAAWAGITAADRVVELGSGRGRSCFWLHAFVGCQVSGVEYNPYFVRRAQAVVSQLGLKGISFEGKNMLNADFSNVTVVYLYGTCLEDELLEELAQKLKQLPAGAKVITVSYSMQEYAKEPLFELVEEKEFPFLWGTTSVYLQRLGACK